MAVMVALGLVSRTDARHDGHVYGFGLETEICDACHSFRHDPQKVCNQSSKVNGWNKTLVYIFYGDISSEPSTTQVVTYRARQLLLIIQ